MWMFSLTLRSVQIQYRVSSCSGGVGELGLVLIRLISSPNSHFSNSLNIDQMSLIRNVSNKEITCN